MSCGDGITVRGCQQRTFATKSASSGLRRLAWIILTGVCTASGIWATHFVAMLAYDPGHPTAYEPVATLASLLIAIFVIAVGFYLSARGDRLNAAAGGAVIGAGIGLMHYTGMYAVVVPGTLHWDIPLVLASLAMGVGLTSMALVRYHKEPGSRGIGIAALLLTLAICGLHFTGMGAVTVVPDPTALMAPSSLDNGKMALAVAGVTLVVLLSGLAAALIESEASKQRQADLHAQNLRFDAALNNMSQGLCMVDAEQRLVVCNKRYVQMYGLPPELTRPGTRMIDILQDRIAKGLYAGPSPAEYMRERRQVALANAPSTTIQELSDGRAVVVVHQPMEGGGAVATHEDITEQRRIERRIAFMAHHDALTGLPNRVLLLERLEQAVKGKGDGSVAVLCLDLDRFKEVNDTLGHSVGDALLKAVAGRVCGCVREADTVARSSGDEFVIVQDSAQGTNAAANLASRVIEVLSQPFEAGGHQVVVGVSIGVAVSPNDGTEPDDLLKHADLALHRAKSQGRGAYCFFEQEMNTRMHARRDMEADLRKALGNGELELLYQAEVALDRNEISGFEALLRWHHPEHGTISPAAFIPLAEETGLIVPIGEWVLRQACTEAMGWPGHVRVAVNISAVQFNHGLVQTVVSALASAGLAANRLELEITETVFLQDNEATLAILGQLSDVGVRIALDDFGTGYSSLSYLRSFPFAKIKIDRCFINDLSETDVNSLAIVRAVAGLGGALGIATTAEGVETEAQLERVRMEGCTEMQGYLFSAPITAAEVSRRFFPRQATTRAA